MADTMQTREYSSNVVRVLYPTQTYTKQSNVYNVDTNCENMLEDLNSSIANSGSTIKTRTIRTEYPEKSKHYTSERIVKDGNRTYHTIGSENTVSYDDMMRTENTSQLDSLLDDLKNERELSMSSGIYHTESNQNAGQTINPTDVKIYKTKNVYKNISSSNNTVGQTRDDTFHRDNQNNFKNVSLNEVVYNTSSRPNNSLRNSNQVVVTSDIPQEIKEIALAEDILPFPGTKVTTTVRTYTYEVPHNGTPHGILTNSNLYNTIDERRHNTSSDINTATYKTNLAPISANPNVQNTYIETTNIVDKNNTQNQHYFPANGSPHHINSTPDNIGPNRTYYYKNISSNTKNTVYGSPRDVNFPNDSPKDGQYPNRPPIDANFPNRSPREVNTSNGLPREIDYPNRIQREPNFASPPKEVIYTHSSPHNESNTVVYRHTHTSTTKNDNYNPNNDHVPIHPVPFPTDEVDRYGNENNPPKRLDDLMASFGNGPSDRRNILSNETSHKVEIDTSLASPGKPTVEPRTLSKNIQGPPVYYPPGQEMSMKREESSAAYRAQGGYAKASGKYEYEAESKSKTKTRSGAAVVPVCLPLCCAMPCSIM